MSSGRRRRRIPVDLPDEIIELLDKLVEEGWFLSRSEAMRYFVVRGAVEYASKVARLKRG